MIIINNRVRYVNVVVVVVVWLYDVINKKIVYKMWTSLYGLWKWMQLSVNWEHFEDIMRETER